MFEPFPILTISPDNTMDLNLKNFSCVNNPSAEYVIIVYYYYPQFSFMRGELLFTKTDCVGILLSQQPKACYLHDFSSSWYEHLLEDFFYGVIRRKIKCVIVNILVSHVVKRVFDEELSWHSSTCPFSVFSFSIDHYFDEFVQWKADFVWKQIEIYLLGFSYQAQGNYTLFENLQHNGSSPGRKPIRGSAKPGLYSKHGHAGSPDLCHPQDIDENIKMMPKQYSHFFLEGDKNIPDNKNMHVRISTATSLNVREELRLFVDLNDMQSYWTKYSFVRFNCSLSVSDPLRFPYLYLDQERERYCKAKKLEYSQWEKAIEHEGFTTYYPVKFSTCVCNATYTYFSKT